MTESDLVGEIAEICKKLAENDVIAERPELPKLLSHLGVIVEAHHNNINHLTNKVAKLERQLRDVDKKTGMA